MTDVLKIRETLEREVYYTLLENRHQLLSGDFKGVARLIIDAIAMTIPAPKRLKFR